jgi:xanthine dehydrogenase YagR molybdenum-binding subunit
MKPESQPKPWGDTAVIGKRLPRVDAYERVSGAAEYTSDITLPGMLHTAILRCPYPHALVKKIATGAAAKMPGVRAILTDSDAEARIPWYFHSGSKKFLSRLFDPHCRYEGEEVAAVAADTPQQAWDAVRAIAVEYEELPFVLDMEEALGANAPKIHQTGNRAFDVQKIERGDVARGFAEADVTIETTYRTACEIHTPLEVHGSVAKWEGNRLTVWDSTQGVFEIQAGLARALKLPLSDVRVICHYMGGGFGSKIALNKHTVIAALIARRTGRPVKACISREESFLAVGNRPAHVFTLKAGAKKDGTIAAFEMHGKATTGAYPDWAVGGFQVADLYRCANVRVEEEQIFTNAGPARAFRAPGFPQCAWALEQSMDALAEKLGMDPVEFRLKNVPTVSQAQGNKPYTSTGLSRCLAEGAEAFGWKQARARAKSGGQILHGVGVAAGLWGYSGGPPSTAIVKIFADGSANLNMGASDLGTGTKTVMAMVVAEELGVPLEKIQIEYADTGTTQYATASGGSKTVVADSPAVRAAALDVKSKLLDMASEQLNVPAADLELRGGIVASIRSTETKVAVADLRALAKQGVVVGVGTRGPNPADKVVRPFAAHFAEVEVNARTGEVRVVRMLAAQDSGRVMNRLTYESQVFGGLTMGIGFGLLERRVLDANTGKMTNANWHDYKIPTALDVPALIECLPIDPHDTECNTTGTKGLGEPATIPTAAAIANAFYHATGVRITETPIRPAQVLALLAARKKV